jgi:hypothetical protein
LQKGWAKPDDKAVGKEIEKERFDIRELFRPTHI